MECCMRMKSPYGNIITMARTNLGLLSKNKKNNLLSVTEIGRNNTAIVWSNRRQGPESPRPANLTPAKNVISNTQSTKLQLQLSFNHNNPIHHEAPPPIPPPILPLHPPLLHSPPLRPSISLHLPPQTSNCPTDNRIRPTPQSPCPQRRTCRFSSR
jgi:hypothetical protein